MDQAPSFFRKLLKWFCKPSLHPYLEGDLLEHFQEKAQTHGLKKARCRFAKDVIKLFRPGIIRSFIPTQKLNTFTMLRHTITITARNFKRHTSTFLINLLGLSSGLIAVLFIYLWVNDELNFDKLHETDAQLYQVRLNFAAPNGVNTVVWTPAPLAPAVQGTIPEIALASRLFAGSQNGVVSHQKGPEIRAREVFADRNLFWVFSFGLIEGNIDNIVPDLKSVAISDQLALKLFNTTDKLIGKTIHLDKDDLTGDYLISGVFKAPPGNSSLQFDAVFSMEQLLIKSPQMNQWNYNNPDTYLVLKPGSDPLAVNTKLEALLKSKPQVEISSTLMHKFSDGYLHGTFKNGEVSGGRITYVRLFSGIALIILLIACINFMNLATAQAAKRLKEVGVKKAMGIHRQSLVFQFLTESVILALIALAVALLFVCLFLPGFNTLVGKQLQLTPDLSLIGTLLAITLTTGLLAGSYPALYLSGFKTVALLKGKLKAKTNDLWFRKGLVIFQFATSIVLILSILVVYQQIELIQNKNLGYDRDNVISFPVEGKISNNVDPFLDEVGNLPGVVSATGAAHSILENGSSTRGVNWEGKDPEEFIPFKYISANYNYHSTLNIELKAGRYYSKEFGNEKQSVVINETAVKTIGLENPIGEVISIWGQNRQIIGVVKDFHLESFYEEVKPLFLNLSDRNYDIMLRIQAGAERETIERVRDFYTEYNNGLAFDFKFMDTKYQELYESENRVSTLAQYFAAIAMIISCLGLFGLATFSAERRIKEIGIRKALGASVSSVIGILTGGFAKMVIISIVIALPFSYWLANDWLNGFAYHIELKWWFFALTGISTLLIAMLTIGLRTFQAARAKPTDCLRYE
ncbi:MAG: FtsX-like permease family protein [Roseivirga sp.]|nr:FtsX-like permease family protein [Roseivirga sp.]